MVEDLSIMAADDGGLVAHTAVAGFYVVSIEQLVVLVVLWEMLIHKFQEVPGNVACHILVEWGVEPYNIAFAVSWFPLWCGVLHVMSVTTVFKGIFIDGFCLIKNLTIT